MTKPRQLFEYLAENMGKHAADEHVRKFGREGWRCGEYQPGRGRWNPEDISGEE